MSKFLNNVSLQDNQLLNFMVHNSASGAGITGGNRKGAMYFDTSANKLMVNDGTNWVPVAVFNATSNTLTLQADPINALDAATKQYVDNAIQGISAKDSVEAATVGANITLAGGAPSTLDGVALAVGNRVLVKDQTAPAENGIYTVTTLGSGANGTWARSYDANTWTELENAYVLVSAGTTNGSSGWVCTIAIGAGTLGTTAVTWVQFSQAGIVETASLGSGGADLWGAKTGNKLNFRQLKGSANITVTQNTNDITISATGLGTGTVTGATFTGGLISVTGSSTLAFTVAGTSGGIPYFSSATGWASSAALSQYGLVIGGGAGAAPSTLAGQGTTGQVLLSGNGTAAPSWGQVGLTTGVTGILPVANGGTGTAYFGITGLTALRTLTIPDANDTFSMLGAIQTYTAAKTFTGAVSITGANVNTNISPTGTGSVTINPATAGTINNMSIGATTASTGKFTSVTSDTFVSSTGAAAAVALFNTDVTTGSVSLAGALTTGVVNIANGTAFTSTSAAVNIMSGALATAATRTVNIGANGSTSSTTTINIGTGATNSTAANVNIGTSAKSLTTVNGSLTLTNLTATSTGFLKVSNTGVVSVDNTTYNTTNATVSSVSFTGGLITVATATTTPALTVAGTSGGIVYFSAANTWASSGALTQYGVVIGGGAGAAPTSTAAGGANTFLRGNGASAPTWGAVNLASADVTGTLPVGNGGTGITSVSSGSLAITGAIAVKKLVAITAANGLSGAVFTCSAAAHGLSSNIQIMAQVMITSTGEVVYPDITVTTAGAVTITFATAPTDGTYSVLLIG